MSLSVERRSQIADAQRGSWQMMHNDGKMPSARTLHDVGSRTRQTSLHLTSLYPHKDINFSSSYLCYIRLDLGRHFRLCRRHHERILLYYV
jgi:hypothetical protein